MDKIQKQSEAYRIRDELFEWFKKFTFNHCDHVDQIAVTRDSINSFTDHAGQLVFLEDENPGGYDVYGGDGIVVIDVGNFRLVYVD